MNDLPKDPAILLSYLNMKLRDAYGTPQELCDDLGLDPTEFNDYIASRGISYFAEGRRFVLD